MESSRLVWPGAGSRAPLSGWKPRSSQCSWLPWIQTSGQGEVAQAGGVVVLSGLPSGLARGEVAYLEQRPGLRLSAGHGEEGLEGAVGVPQAQQEDAVLAVLAVRAVFP